MELGNQQERPEADLHWLGGFFDGEGSISLLASCRTRLLQISPSARIVQNSQSAIDEICRILKANDLAFHVAQLKQNKLASRPTFQIMMNGIKRCHRFLRVVKPFLRFKRKDCDIALEFIESRLSSSKQRTYTEHEVDLFIQLRELHGYRLRESSETIRKTLLEGRYSPTSARKTESATETIALRVSE